jgi:hypothetical protein
MSNREASDIAMAEGHCTPCAIWLSLKLRRVRSRAVLGAIERENDEGRNWALKGKWRRILTGACVATRFGTER